MTHEDLLLKVDTSQMSKNKYLMEKLIYMEYEDEESGKYKPKSFKDYLLDKLIEHRMKELEVEIGSQIWHKEDLKVTKFRNGDDIPVIQDIKEWSKIEKTAAMCINPKTGAYLYNWYAVIDPRGLAPEGWHIPSDEEWTKLIDYLGGEKIAGKKMKSQSWDGSNKSGFSALPTGTRENTGRYDYNYSCCWWSSSVSSAWFLKDCPVGRMVSSSCDYIKKEPLYPLGGFNVRCIKDN